MVSERGCVATAKATGLPYQTVFGVLRHSELWERGKFGRGVPYPCSAAKNVLSSLSDDESMLSEVLEWTKLDDFEKYDKLHPVIERFFKALGDDIERRSTQEKMGCGDRGGGDLTAEAVAI
jgi:hypothetical protein